MANKLKVLIVSASDVIGGAHKAAYRLHRALLDQGVDSQMLVQNKYSNDCLVIGARSNIRRRLINPLRPAADHIIMKAYKIHSLFSSSYFPFSEIIKQIDQVNPDVVHLHWITGGMMRIEDIARIKYPVIWSCHDMWPFTGGCHYSGKCTLYKQKCGKCPMFNSDDTDDLSSKIYSRKKNILARIDSLAVVGLSKWMTNCIKESSLFVDKKITNIPNCIDSSLFKPISKSSARDTFKIPKNKKVILFSAANPEEARKGKRELLQAIDLLNLDSIVLVILGQASSKNYDDCKYPMYFIPKLRDEISLPVIYNIADVVVVPSLEENLANSILESLSCGIPVVSFNIGGNGDAIEHKKNGYLAKAFDISDLAKGIEWVLSNEHYKKICQDARKKVLRDFAEELVSKKYISLYKSVIKEHLTKSQAQSNDK